MMNARRYSHLDLNLEIQKHANKISLLEKELQETNEALEEKLNMIEALEIHLQKVIGQVEKLKQFSRKPLKLV